MGSTFGRTVLSTVGQSVQVAADARPDMKPGGVTIDWSTVAVVNSGADTTWNESFVIPAGEKGLCYGQILTRITAQPAYTITVTGTPTSGNVTASITNPLNGVVTSTTILYNSTVAQTQALMDTAYGAGNTLVSGAGALPGNVQTVTLQGALIEYAPTVPTVTANGLTGGSTPALAFASTAAGGNYGDFGPFDPSASDGRQTLTRGDCFILNESVSETGSPHSNHPPALQGGLCWKSRILMTTGSHSLAAGPTVTEFEAAFPNVRYAKF